MQSQPSTEPLGAIIARQSGAERQRRLVELAKWGRVRLGPVAQSVTEQPSILDVMTSPQYLGDWFAKGDWTAWQAFLAGIFGLPMSPAMLAIWSARTGRSAAPDTPATEAWMIVGRRGGKSRIAALIAVYLTCFRDYSPYLSPGEKGTVPVIAADRKEARTIMGYVKGFLQAPALRGRVLKALTESIELSGHVQIEMHTAGFRAVRGYTVIGALCDEIAFWDTTSEAANPDHEVIAALTPGMSSIPGALLVGLSSPYARAGVLWEKYAKHYGQTGDPVVVWQAATQDMHPGIDQAKIDAAYRDDPDAAAAEYGGEFRRDVESFVSRESIADAVIVGREMLPPVSGTHYVAFVDPSGGAVDSMTLAIAHAEGQRGVLDAVLEVRPPFNPASVTVECVALLRQYRITSVTGDRYGGEWPRERFRELNVDYLLSEMPKSDIYIAFLAHMNSRHVELLDNHVMLNQLRQLERRRGRGGRDIVDHPPKGHDDVINAAAGALLLAQREPCLDGIVPIGIRA